MDWMKEILKANGIEVSDETVFDAISEEIGKRYADKGEFEQKENEIVKLQGKISEFEEKEKNKTDKADGGEKTYTDADIETIRKDYEDKLNEVKFSSALDLEIQKSGAKSKKALKALLDMDKIGFEDGSLTGFAEQLEKVKNENGYLFDDGLDTGLKHDGKEAQSGIEQAFYNINPDLKK